MSDAASSQTFDVIINWVNKLSYTGGGVTIGSLITYKEQLSIIFSATALFFTMLTFFVSLYFQVKRNQREEQDEKRKAILFVQEQEERRLGLIEDTGERRRKTDND